MTDPTLNFHQRPIYLSETEERGVINLDEYRLNLGVLAHINGTGSTLPEDIGRFVVRLIDKSSKGKEEESTIPSVPCSEIFKDVNQDLDEHAVQAKSSGSCLDPTQAVI